eukprot:6876212-Prymnesium_polylepis.1
MVVEARLVRRKPPQRARVGGGRGGRLRGRTHAHRGVALGRNGCFGVCGVVSAVIGLGLGWKRRGRVVARPQFAPRGAAVKSRVDAQLPPLSVHVAWRERCEDTVAVSEVERCAQPEEGEGGARLRRDAARRTRAAVAADRRLGEQGQ